MEYLTLVEAAKLMQNPLQRGVVEIFPRTSPVLQYLPFLTINGNAYTYNREETMPNIGFRGLNETYTADTGVINPITESLKIYGGISQVDRALVKTQGNVNDLRAAHDAMKAKAASLEFTESFFNGDSESNPKQFDGLAKRLTGNQVIDNGGAALTLAALDRLIDAVVGTPDVIFCNKVIRRRINALMRSAGQAMEPVNDVFGKQIPAYAGIPIGVIEEGRDGTDILSFDETIGVTLPCATSIYAVRFGVMEYLSGLQASPIEVLDLGLQNGVFYQTLIEHIASIAIFHGKSAARLKGITDTESGCTTTSTTTTTTTTTT